MDLNKEVQQFTCDDCGQAFCDYIQFHLHRKYHSILFQGVTTEEILEEGTCPFCFVNHFEEFEDIRLGSREIFKYKQENKAKQAVRCKYYPRCNEEFYRSFEFARHVKEVHNDDKPYTCQQCNYDTPRHQDLKRHLISHVSYKMFRCHLCLKEYKARISLKKHLLLKHKDTRIPHNCSVCGKKYAVLSDLKKHFKTHFPTPETFKCHLCPKEYTTKPRLNCHISRHNKHRRFICSICCKGFSRKDSFKRHGLIHSGKKRRLGPLDKKPFDCKGCGKGFLEKREQNRHLDPEKESKNLLCCKKCPKTFKNFNCFAYHERTHREFLCEVCKKKCFTPKGFKMHLEAHGIKLKIDSSFPTLVAEDTPSPENPIKCSFCPKVYRSKLGLKYHLRKHEGKEPHVCKECGEVFMAEMLLEAHLNPEKEIKQPISCKECSETFTNINCINYHRRSHMEELLCGVCEAKCYTRKGMKIHLAKHGIRSCP